MSFFGAFMRFFNVFQTSTPSARRDPECKEENESSKPPKTSTCCCGCSPTDIFSHGTSLCFSTPLCLRLPPPLLTPSLATPEWKKDEPAPVNMPGWRSQWRLLLLNFLTCGLEICVAAGITYVPPLLLEAGVDERYMTMVLGIGPVLGLLFIPLIGSASDHCNSSYGRRKPFIWLLSFGIILALFIIPHADFLSAQFSWGGETFQVGFLILGVGLLDFCGQMCFTPLEALLSDLYQSEEECSQAFAMFSFMVSLGGCVGYLLPALDWSQSQLSVYLGGQEECLFFVLIIIFISSVFVTMKVSAEPSASIGSADSGSSLESGAGTKQADRCGMPNSCCYLLKFNLRLLTPVLCLIRTCQNMTPVVYKSYCNIPRVMRPLCVAQLCSWIAVMSFMLFFTNFVGEGLYEGVPSASPGSTLRQRYEEGVRMGSLGLFLQCATSTFFSLVMSRIVRQFGSRLVYVSSMVSFTVSALVICLSKNVVLVTVMAALTGYAYATLQTLPYTLTCHYHKEKEVYMPKKRTKSKNNGIQKRDSLYLPVEDEGSTNHKTGDFYMQNFHSEDSYEYYNSPLLNTQHSFSHSSCGTKLEDTVLEYDKRGVGLDFAILDSTFLLSQVFPTLFMGMIVHFTQSVTAYIACSVFFGVVAIYLAGQIVFDHKDLKAETHMEKIREW